MSRIFASPGRYIQGRGVVGEVGVQASRYGESAFVISDKTVWNILEGSFTQSFSQVDGNFHHEFFSGECTKAEIARLTDVALEVDPDVVVGVGGGKSIDTAKSVSAQIDAPLGSVPTIASTDSPTSSISVLYDENGVMVGGEHHDFHPEFVLVDTAVIAKAPTRWFISGIGDALSTWFEAKATRESGGTTVFDAHTTYAGQALAETCYRLLREHAEGAVRAVESNVVTESVEAVTEAIVLLSGLGFENGGLAAAHAIHDGLTTLPGATNATHGEKVMVGLLAQVILGGEPDKIVKDLVSFGKMVGLPVSLAGIGITSPTRADLMEVGRVACEAEETSENGAIPLSPEQVADALSTLDSLVE